jgi:hypothetical protein
LPPFAALQILEAEGIDLVPFAKGVEWSSDAAAAPELLLTLAAGNTPAQFQAAAADAMQSGWCSGQRNSPEQERMRALAVLRRLLVLSRQQPGPAGLLSNTAAVEALQELLPFAPLMQMAAHDFSAQSSSSGSKGLRLGDPGDMRNQSILFLLPPAQRAWLLADAAAAVLLPEEGGRWATV